MDSGCPEFDLLERFSARSLDDASSAEIRLHLAGCGTCHERLGEIRANLGVAPTIGRALRPPMPEPAEWEEIDGFRIVREIGRGGMGVVYEAEQVAPRRRVALKLLHRRAATDDALRRFEHESRALARLHHRGIAQVYAAGTFDTHGGPQPYFAMELVHGRTLRRYADEEKLDTRRRLALMAQVCDAVEHAHRQGVIHRDLKPGNILIDESGDAREPQPKVLDFGVARLTDADMQATLHTEAGQIVGTLPYMSPEQLAGDPQALDSRSDVYSLGVVLYELLSGRLPIEVRPLNVAETVRRLCEDRPRPIGAVDRRLRGELETIVMHALQREPARRYESALALGSDIRRYLGHEPISARPPSAAYQLRKFARRHRAAVAGAVLVLVILIGATIVSLRQASRAMTAEQNALRQLDLAERESAKSLAVRRFLEDMLGAAAPDMPGGRMEVTVRETLEKARAGLAQGELDAHPEARMAICTALGNSYRSLGDYESAEQLLDEAVRIGRSAYPNGHADLSFAMNKLGRTLQERGRFDGAEALFREALEMRRRLLGDEHEDVATMLNNLGTLLTERGRTAEARDYHERALAIRRRLFGEEHSGVATSLNNLGQLSLLNGDLREAEAAFRKSLEIDVRLRGEEHANVATTMANLAYALHMQQRLDEAETLYRQAMDIRRRILPEGHPHIAHGLNSLAVVLAAKGDFEEAEKLYRESLEMERRARGDRHPAVATKLVNLAELLMNRERHAEAEQLLTESLAIQREALGESHADTLGSLFRLANLWAGRGELERATGQYEYLIATARRGLGAEHWHVGAFLREHGKCLSRQGRHGDAEAAMLEAHRIMQKTFGDKHVATRSSVNALAALYDGWNKPEEAARWRAKLPAPPASQPSN